MAKILKNIFICCVCFGLAACAFPKRDNKAMPDVSLIQVQLVDGEYVAVPPDCDQLYREYAHKSFDSRPQYAFGCATYTNLANSVANPKDLVKPKSYPGQQIDTATDAVTRYRQNKVTDLRETDTTAK